VVLDVPAEDVADSDVFESKGFGQERGMGTLAAAWTPMMMYLRIPSPAFARRSWEWCPGNLFSVAVGTAA
jgi:hypothetical protein